MPGLPALGTSTLLSQVRVQHIWLEYSTTGSFSPGIGASWITRRDRRLSAVDDGQLGRRGTPRPFADFRVDVLMLPNPSVRWYAVPDAALAWREWDGEVVVFNQETGSTHLLNALGAEVLRRLVASGARRDHRGTCWRAGRRPERRRRRRNGRGPSARYCPNLRGSVWRDRKRLDRCRPVGPRARTTAGRPRPPAANGTLRHANPVPAACGRRGDCAPLRGISDRRRRELCRFPRTRRQARAISAGGCSRRRISSSTGICRLRPFRSTRRFRCSSGGSTGASRRTATST